MLRRFVSKSSRRQTTKQLFNILKRDLRLEFLEMRQLMATNVLDDTFNFASGSLAFSPAITLNVLTNDDNGATTQAVSAANIDYTASNKVGNTAAYVIPVRPSSTQPQRSLIVGGVSVPTTSTNYADIVLSKDSDNLDNGNATLSANARTEAIVLATVRENVTPNNTGNTATTLAVLNYNTEGVNTSLSSEAGPANDGENIIRPAVARFPYAAGWIGGSYNTTGGAVVANSALTVSATATTGQYIVAVDGVADSRSDGYLFSIASGNSDNYSHAIPLGGNQWQVNTRDNASTFAGGENVAFSVLYVPGNSQGLIGGHIRGDAVGDNPVIRSNGNFAIVRTGNGTWNMSIPGQSPTSGMLVIETADYDRARGANVYFSYQAATNGTDFVIRQMQFEGTATNLLNDDFVVFFVPFENQIQPIAPLTITQVGTASNPSGNLSTNGIPLTINSDNTVSYGYPVAQLRALSQGQIVTDTFVYQASDGVNTASATATINLRGFNEAPTVTTAIPTLSFNEDGPSQTVDLTTIFGDVDTTDVLTYAVNINGNAQVTASISGSTLTITPKANQYGAFSYTVTASDPFGASVTSALAQGNITPVVEGAQAVADTSLTSKFTPIDLNVLSNDFDPENSLVSVAAANIAGNTDATTDAATVWTVSQASVAPNNLQVVGIPPTQNLGDLTVAQNGVLLQQSLGVLLASVASDTTPYNSVDAYGDILNNTAGYVLATDAGIGATERNTPLGAAFFPYADGWTSGHVDNTGNLRSGIGVSQANVTRVAAGLFEIAIPEATSSETSGFLFAMTASNDDNIISVRPMPGTNRWQVRNTDNDDAVNGFEDDGFSFVYIPAATTGLIGGRWSSLAGSLVQQSGAVTVTNNAGVLTISIAGQTPTSGTLLAIGTGGTTAVVNANTIDVPQNLVPGYVASGNDFVLSLRASATLAQTAGDVQFIFLPHATPLERLAPNAYTVTSVSPTSVNGAAVSINSNGTVHYDPTSAGGAIAALQAGQSLSDTFTYTITDSQGRTSTATATVTVTGDIVTITPFNGLATTEAAGSVSVSMVLVNQPTADVTIQLLSSDPTEGVPAVSSIVFTPANWNVPQLLTINGVDDFVDDGDVSYSIITTAVSSDPLFSDVAVTDISAVNTDNDTAGITVTPSSGLITTERGDTATFTIVLTSEPLADVAIGLASSNSAEGTVSPTALTFTSTNWSTPQTVTVTGVDDAVVDANILYQVITSAATSTDPLYLGRAVPDVSVTNTNLDIAVTTSTGVTRVGTGMTGIGIDGRIILGGTGAYLLGGTLTVSITAGGSASDRLEARNEGTNTGQVGVTGSDITFGGVVVGTFAGGVGAPLVVTFNAAATRLAAQAVARSITYQEVNPTASGTRTATFALVDGDGQVSPTQTKQLSVGIKRVLEVQEGVDRGWGAYAGGRDIQLSESSPNASLTTGGDANGLLVDWPDAGVTNTAQVLLRFENLFGTALGQLPAGAIVTSASLVVQTNNTGDGALMYRMKQAWNESTSTWNNWTGGVQADDVEARATFDSFWNTFDVSGATGTGLMSVSVTPDVRAWLGGEANFGWLMTPHSGGTDGWAFSPSEASDVNARPMLRIEWVPAGTQSIVLQQDLDGYTGTADTRIANTIGTSNADAETVGTDYLDATTPISQTLIKFDSIVGNAVGQMPANARIDDAILNLTSLTSNAVGHGGPFHRMLVNWTEDTTWAAMGDGVSADGVEAATAFSTQAGNSSLNPLAQAGRNDFEVIADLQAWTRGTANYGWMIEPWINGTDGWFFSSSEYVATPAYRPKLEVFFTELPNNAPTDIQLSPAAVAENLPTGTIVGTLTSTDPDAGNTFTYTLVTGTGDADNAAFTIVGDKLQTAAALDFETRSSYTVRVRTTDQGGQAFGAQSFEKVMTITIANTNDAPVVTASSGNAIYSNAIVALDSGIQISDFDSVTLSSGVVAITTGYLAAEDVLSFANTATITGTFDSVAGTLTLTGADTVANYQAALRTVQYNNTQASPTLGNRLITFQVNDGATVSNLSNTATRTLIVSANQNPLVAANAAAVSGAEGTTITNSGTWSDANASDVIALTASVGTIVNNANGTWSWSIASTDNQVATSVTITANDGNGGVSTTSFTYTVNNVAPTVAATSAAVSGIVLTTITNTGTYGDVPADTVTLTASAGTLVNNGNGTWSWSVTPTAGVNNQTVTITATDEDGGSSTTTFSLTAIVDVVDRKMFYNNSGFETVGGVVAALDTNKLMLRSGATTQTTAFANVSNYTRGINGAVLDVAGLASASLTPADFIFRVAPSGASGVVNPSTWANAPAPSALIVTAGTATAPGRVQLEWTDNQIQNTWLQIVVRANANTGLTTPAVFYLGHAQAEINGVGPYRVSVADLSPVQTGISTSLVGVNDLRDLNKDRRVTVADLSFVQARVSTTVNLNNITIPVAGSSEEGSGPSNSPIVLNSRASSPTGIAVPVILGQSTVIASGAVKSDERPVQQETRAWSLSSGQPSTQRLVSQLTNSTAQRKSQGAESTTDSSHKQWNELVDNYFSDL